MAEKDFAIVCDATCDLPLSFLEKAAVVPVRLDGAGGPVLDERAAAERLYRSLAAAGHTQVVSVHSAACFSPLVAAARAAAEDCAGVADVRVVDSGSASVATGMLVDRAARYRHFDVAFEDAVAGLEALASRVRLLALPAPGSRLAGRRRRPRGGLIGRAAASLRTRVTGERGLYLLSHGEVTQLARNNDRAALLRRLAHAVGTVANNDGALVSALADAGDARTLRALERALVETDADVACLGTVRALAPSEEALGSGSVALAIAPSSAYWRDEASLAGLGSQNGVTGSGDEQNDRAT